MRYFVSCSICIFILLLAACEKEPLATPELQVQKLILYISGTANSQMQEAVHKYQLNPSTTQFEFEPEFTKEDLNHIVSLIEAAKLASIESGWSDNDFSSAIADQMIQQSYSNSRVFFSKRPFLQKSNLPCYRELDLEVAAATAAAATCALGGGGPICGVAYAGALAYAYVAFEVCLENTYPKE